MDIEEYKIRYGYKELPWHFYLRGALFWCWFFMLPLGFLSAYKIIDWWFAMLLYTPWCIFWCFRAVAKMNDDKLKVDGK